MTKHRPWSEVVQVRARYQRSVHLERDAGEPSWLRGYVPTPLVRTLTARIARGLAAGATSRAWSITGPYGSGKSAFALFLSHLLRNDATPTRAAARKLLAEHDSALSDGLFGRNGILRHDEGLLPVLVTGERQPIERLILRALRDAVVEHWSGPGAKPDVIRAVQAAAVRAENGEAVGTREVVELVCDVANRVARSKQPGRGLFVILDEGGKALEHAAQHPAQGDVQVLQELAEAASRSGDAPIVFAVVLHQAFEQYAGKLSTSLRNDWAKIQGRFEDLPFQEGSDQLLRLIASALQQGDIPRTWKTAHASDVSRTAPLIRGRELADTEQTRKLLAGAAPLHPTTALILGPLFRSRLAQNERSLFAFLASTEPHGFGEFLATPRSQPCFYRLDRLYDYLAATYGLRLFGSRGDAWAQIESALRRLPRDANELDARVVKVVGLLGAIGEAAGLHGSCDVLRAALGESDDQVRAAVERLVASSVLVYRKYRDSYQLWEGSDLDLDALIGKSARSIGGGGSLVDRLMRVAPPRPLVARRHLFETGTLRYFEVRYGDETCLDGDLQPRDANADGIAWLVIPTSDPAGQAAWRQVGSSTRWLAERPENRPVLIGVAKDATRIRDLATELAAIEQVLTQTPELQTDHVARRELAGRLSETELLLRQEIALLLAGQSCQWAYRAAALDLGSSRDLTALLSKVCGDTYRLAPHVTNEMLNRRQLSSAGASARRQLIQAMLSHAGEEQLGMTGHPPEVAMYRSLVRDHGLHVQTESGWHLAAPAATGRGSLKPAWDALHDAIERQLEGRVVVSALYEVLRAPPFGMKDGPVPVLLVHALLLAEHDMALYEDGTFVPVVTSPVVERLLRTPEKFALQRYPIVGARAELFAKLAEVLSGTTSQRVGLVSAVRPLVRLVADLPEFARNTKTVSPLAQAVREAMLRAKEPAPLLFRDLPNACGTQPFAVERSSSPQHVDEFIVCLRGALRELRTAYPHLLDSIAAALCAALHLPAEPIALRTELASRAAAIYDLAAETHLRAFLVRARDADLDRDEWLVSLGTLLTGRPPESWRDQDERAMHSNLRVLARRFRSLEALALDARQSETESDESTVLRIAIAQPGLVEREEVATIRSTESAGVQRFCAWLLDEIRGRRADTPREALLAGLGLVAHELMREMDGETATDDAEAHQ